MSTLLPWFVTAILCLVTFVWGEARRSEREGQRYEKLVGDDATQRTAIRMLCKEIGMQMPDLWQAPEPKPGRWDGAIERTAARLHAAGGWVKARLFAGPTEVEAAQCSDCGKILTQPDERTSGLCLRCLNGPLPEPLNEWDEADYRRQADADMAALIERVERHAEPEPGTGTGPDTDTDEMPAAPGLPTQPQAAIGTRVEDLSLARALADIEYRIRAWQETHI